MIVLYKLFFATALLVSVVCFSPAAKAQTVTFNTNVGDIVVELLPDEAPISVANFLGYVERGDYVATLIHRSVANFVIQGGGFSTDFSSIPLQPSITNEFGRSNIRGTLAYARSSAVNSATSQFFFNVADNGGDPNDPDVMPRLDFVNEGFTVFGEVVSGMEVVDSINGLQRGNFGDFTPFTEVPIQAIQPDNTVLDEDFVILNSVTVLVLGDVNQDGVVNFLDITPFISILSGENFLEEADINQDSIVNFLDITPFISILSAG